MFYSFTWHVNNCTRNKQLHVFIHPQGTHFATDFTYCLPWCWSWNVPRLGLALVSKLIRVNLIYWSQRQRTVNLALSSQRSFVSPQTWSTTKELIVMDWSDSCNDGHVIYIIMRIVKYYLIRAYILLLICSTYHPSYMLFFCMVVQHT